MSRTDENSWRLGRCICFRECLPRLELYSFEPFQNSQPTLLLRKNSCSLLYRAPQISENIGGRRCRSPNLLPCSQTTLSQRLVSILRFFSPESWAHATGCPRGCGAPLFWLLRLQRCLEEFITDSPLISTPRRFDLYGTCL